MRGRWEWKRDKYIYIALSRRAALQGNAAAVRSLVGGGAAADPANDDGDTPLHLASQADMIYYNIYYNIL